MTYTQFVKKYAGKAIDYDGRAGVQCVDLVDQYLKDVFGITGVWVSGARDFYNNFYNLAPLPKYFDRIPNTRSLVDKTGDIVIWGGGKWGHCAIATGLGNINYFFSYEQNTMGKHEPMQRVMHYYNHKIGVDGAYPVLGVLRAKEEYQHLINGNYIRIKVVYAAGMNLRDRPTVSAKIVGHLSTGQVRDIVDTTKTYGQTWGRIANTNMWLCCEPKFVQVIAKE